MGLIPGQIYCFSVHAQDEESNLSNSNASAAAKVGDVCDDANKAWKFMGNWTSVKDTTGPYADTLHYSTKVGNNAEISFTGPGRFMLTYTGYSKRGFLNIYVDGTLVYSLYRYDPGLVW